MSMKNILQHFRNKWVLIALLTATMAILVLPAFSPAETEAAPVSGINYIDETGTARNTDTLPGHAVEDLSGAITSLVDTGANAGWYFLEANHTFGTLAVSGNVHLILGDGFTMTVTTLNVPSTATLTIYPQSGKTGKITSTGTGITLAGGTLVNVATIEAGTNGVNATASTSVIDNYGTIKGTGASSYGILAGGVTTVHNFGSITSVGASGYGLRANAAVSLVNNAGGLIDGAIDGVYYTSASTSSTFENYGTVSSAAGGNALYVAALLGADIYNGTTGRITSPNSTMVILTAGNTLVNLGRITSTTGSALGITADNVTIKNYGEISTQATSSTSAGIVSTSAGAAKVYNYLGGTISGFYGISFEGVSSTTNTNRSIENYGTITATGSSSRGLSISAPFAGDIYNGTTGVITGATYGVYFTTAAENSIINYGKISTTAATSYVIYTNVNYTTIKNYGEISSTGGSSCGIQANSITLVNNYFGGTISTVGNAVWFFTNSANSTFYNYGTISGSGSSGYGVMAQGLLSGIIYNDTTGVITGGYIGLNSTFGNSLINLGEIRSTAVSGTGVAFGGSAGGTIKNYGTISAGATGAGSYGMTVGASTDVYNYQGGTIKGYSYGIFFNTSATGSSIDNHGDIAGTFTGSLGIQIQCLMTNISNGPTGTIKGVLQGMRITNAGNNTITNLGEISSSGTGTNPTGIEISSGATTLNTIKNYGDIKGNGASSFGVYATSPAKVINYTGGAIEGTLFGVWFAAGSANSTVDNRGTIKATATVTGSSGLFTQVLLGEFKNDTAGIIEGVQYGARIWAAGNTITNLGEIKATGTSSYAVHIGANNISVKNHGKISGAGTGSFGILAAGVATIDNYSDGLVNGTQTGVYFTTGSSNSVIKNQGCIYGTGAGGCGLYVEVLLSGEILNDPTGIIEGVSFGVVFTGGGNVLSNEGEINAIRNECFGVYVLGSITTIKNHGIIYAKGDTGYGIYAVGEASIENHFNGIVKGTEWGIKFDTGSENSVIENNGDILGTDFSTSGGLCTTVTLSTINNGTTGIIGGTACGIFIEDTAIDNTILNFGEVTGYDGPGIKVMAAGTTVENDGKISGWRSNGIGIHAVVPMHIINNAEIDGAMYGIYADTYATIDNILGAEIKGRTGIYFGDLSGAASSFDNYGLIEGTVNGIKLGNGGAVKNLGGEIAGGTNGIIADAGSTYLENWSLITGNVALTNDANEVVLAAFSIIDGNLAIGSNAGSTFDFVGTPNPVVPLFATVSGSADIGKAVVAGMTVPAGFDGRTIVLIDTRGVGGITGTPGNSTITVGGILMDVKVRSHIQLIVEKPAEPGPVYYITASADSGSTITPSGVISVDEGNDQTFVFSAKPGYKIADVWIDGIYPLSQSQIDSGEHTFINITADHTIEVKTTLNGSKKDITLRIDIIDGNGHAEYDIGAGFVKYTGVVTLPEGSNVVVKALAAKGYQFDRWETPDVETTSELTFNDLTVSLYLELYFAVDDSGLVVDGALLWIILLLIIAALLFLIFMLWIRSGFFLTIMKGKAVEGASVTYRVEKDGKTVSDIKRTDSRGRLKIAAKRDSVVTISMAAKDGNIAIGLPLTIVMERRKEHREITLR